MLFVSHNLGAVKQLCSKGLVLDFGQNEFLGSAGKAIQTYKSLFQRNNESVWVNDVDKNPKVLLERIEIRNIIGELSSTFFNSEVVNVHFYLHSFQSIKSFTVAFDLVKDDIVVLRSRQVDSLVLDNLKPGDEHHFFCQIPAWFLNAGQYYIKPMISVHCVENLSNAYDINL